MFLEWVFLGIPVWFWSLIVATILGIHVSGIVEITSSLTKGKAAIGFVVFLALGLVGAGMIAPSAFTQVGEGEEVDVGAADIFEFADTISSDTHVTEYQEDTNTILVRYEENTSSGTARFAGDSTELDEVKFDIDIKRTDWGEDNILLGEVYFVLSDITDAVENSDETNSPFNLVEDHDDDTYDAKITIGSSAEYESQMFSSSAATATTVTLRVVPNDTALANIELYDSVSQDVRVRNKKADDDTLTIKYQKTGEVS
jgi:hypothetical protein